MSHVRLIVWNPVEVEERLRQVSGWGYTVKADLPDGPAFFRALKADPPQAFLIDLSRAPSRGRDLAVALRCAKATRLIPIVFLEGEPLKREQIKKLLPDAVFTTWAGARSGLSRSIAAAPRNPIVPDSVFAAYRGQPLLKKLGIKPGWRIGVVHAPGGFRDLLGDLPQGARLTAFSEDADMIIWFAGDQAEVQKALVRSDGCRKSVPLWLVWRKKGATPKAAIGQKEVRAAGLAAGWVDFKICAIDETWSGLKFVRRK